MSLVQWQDLQWALLWTFSPLLHWGLVAFLSLSFGVAVWTIWLGLLRALNRSDADK